MRSIKLQPRIRSSAPALPWLSEAHHDIQEERRAIKPNLCICSRHALYATGGIIKTEVELRRRPFADVKHVARSVSPLDIILLPVAKKWCVFLNLLALPHHIICSL